MSGTTAQRYVRPRATSYEVAFFLDHGSSPTPAGGWHECCSPFGQGIREVGAVVVVDPHEPQRERLASDGVLLLHLAPGGWRLW